ncbi:class I SAM-dependent methyltransferase [Paenarthrobacter sp. Z7-10]|uniref:class I SAM-dependent methyltransferase n=1 Tax=Paenarthrobacter sp. Z7-10 TaxID=2787635 RepID=UPI0022A996C0|nr:class I SAM-dependent methyltransferase [Paenarthrobacter sp. Z7-10]MCZ2402981.1 class I SAM-dependent methyltransferase [Paenarthrobacter sp. Z7-10]
MRPDDEFFLTFATRTPGARVLDLGCGTGRLSLAISGKGCSVVGIDPDLPSLAAARAQPHADHVSWVAGDSRALETTERFDAAIMTSNVVQEILDDTELARSFADIAAHLVGGGRLAFDARDPRARGWEAWTKARSSKVVHLPDGDSQHWYQTTRVDEQTGMVDFSSHEVTVDGVEHISRGPIRFRSEDQLRAMVAGAGLAIDDVWGGFRGEAVGDGVGSLVFTAHRP